MITFQGTYDSRKNEIENFLELMKFLEQKENEREWRNSFNISSFDKYFKI